MPNQGTLILQLTAANQALPVPGASVTVTAAGTPGVVLAHRTTDENGRTDPILFLTPDPSMSTSPDEGVGYAAADALIRAKGFYDVRIRDVQIFPGVESLLQTELIPLSEGSNGDGGQSFDIPPQTL